ncbi:Lipoyltransferase/lipoate-protein ligase [Syntrophomonas zehnderi OL-4]|uniref:lipoate--protein ligase n=1 Tax=Syntrophomonas zehnderi OL-4 TaxID=690567 RepID=A0A0E4C7Z4_9FIRM|nr:lipoate--protein ligase [Syntrophomonas zehnderi]CFX18309.1 Lipoyltransferase/lipoate-protein ligase [Syntrophomonas zehnderi OL-4]
MIHLINPSTDPYFNLALEEYLLMNEFDLNDYFLLWQDRPVVVVGRNQNTLEEINLEAIRSQGVEVVRRLSGGGAVYHDEGNLNFTFIVNDENRSAFDFARFTEPVIETLDKMGIKAENSGRNDITIAGKKFSGNAQCRFKHRLLHHGTLMFDCRIEDMVKVLNVSPDKIVSKGVKSVRSRVTNISEHIKQPVSLEQFKDLLVQTVRDGGYLQGDRQLSKSELLEINKLRQKKYISWDWVYGNSPPFNIQRKKTFPWGTVDLRLDIKNGLIEKCKIYGDFFSNRDVTELGRDLTGTPYRQPDIDHKLAVMDLNSYFPAANPGEIEGLIGDGLVIK